MKHLYVAVTPDEYELPLFVADKRKDLAEWAGLTTNAIHLAIARGFSGKFTGVKYIKVALVEDDL